MQTYCRYLVGVLLLSVAGCGSADGRYRLSGKVSIDGQPAEAATISFKPIGHQANTAGVTVQAGAFALPANKGLRPGRYAVSVQAYRVTGRTFDDPQRGGKMPELLPVPIAAIEPAEIEISGDRPNVFEIQVTTGSGTAQAVR